MRAAVVVTENYSAWNFRRGLLSAAAQSGIDTHVICPSGDYDQAFQDLGVTHVPIKVDRVVNPLLDMEYFFSLQRIFREKNYDVVHNISIKPNIYGSLAARKAGIKNIVGSVTGLGNVYMDEMGAKFRMMRPVVSHFYKRAFQHTSRVWFQNADDAAFFTTKNMLDPDKVVIIKGSGVNLADFSPEALDREAIGRLRQELGLTGRTFVVTMVSRALKSKGVEDFIEAANIASAQYPQIKFLLAGDAEEGNPLSLSGSYLRSKQSDHFTWLGWRHDVREILGVSDVVTLPSRYREGIPKSLLEAAAMSKAIVTTDVIGCREVVEDGVNGFLVAQRDPRQLAAALLKLAGDRSLLETCGERSRSMVLQCFDLNKINQQILEELYQWKN